jgi:hypothetical protein
MRKIRTVMYVAAGEIKHLKEAIMLSNIVKHGAKCLRVVNNPLNVLTSKRVPVRSGRLLDLLSNEWLVNCFSRF